MRLILTLLIIMSSTFAMGFERNQLVFPRGWNHDSGAVVLETIETGRYAGLIKIRSNLPPYPQFALPASDLFTLNATVSPVVRGTLIAYTHALQQDEPRLARMVHVFSDNTVQIQDVNPQTLPENIQFRPNPFRRGNAQEIRSMVFLPLGLLLSASEVTGAVCKSNFAAQ